MQLGLCWVNLTRPNVEWVPSFLVPEQQLVAAMSIVMLTQGYVKFIEEEPVVTYPSLLFDPVWCAGSLWSEYDHSSSEPPCEAPWSQSHGGGHRR